MARLIDVLIDSEQVIDHLKHEVKLRSVYHDVLCRQIVNRVAAERGIVVPTEEIQGEADKFRYSHKLESAAQTLEWLKSELLTPEDWETGLQERLLSQKLAEEMFGQQVKTYFAQNKIQYEQVVLYRIVVPYFALAQEIFYQIEEEEISFFEAAHLYDADERRQLACGFEGKVYRWQLKPDIAAQVFGAYPRAVIGPLQVDGAFELLMVEEFISAELVPDIYQKILNQFFDEWLESELNNLIYSDQSTSTAHNDG